ncbi:MAG: LysR family transcriptional regulator [Pseudorhodoplanes sp.]|nr:LysR family transcriptional regulator [Pseudorhodoplanes sp.]
MLHGRLLRYVDEVARSGSIRKAAARLNVASSAINRQILALEEEIGSPIFERMPRGLRLTTAGELLIGHVRQTLKEHDRVRARIESLKGLRRGEVTIVTTSGIAGGFLAGIVSRFVAAHPGFKVRVFTSPRDAAIAAVTSGEADLGLAYNLPHNPRLASFYRANFQLGAIMAPGHPLARRVSIRLSDCVQFPLIVADSSMSIRDVIEARAPADLDISLAIESNSIGFMKRMAATVPNISFLNPVDVGEELERGSLVFVPVRELQGQPQVLSLVHRSRAPLENAAHLLATKICASLDQGAAAEPASAEPVSVRKKAAL